MQVIHTTRNGNSILLIFPLFCSILYDCYIPVETQRHADGAQRAWAACGSTEERERLLVRVIGRFEKLRVQEIGIPLYFQTTSKIINTSLRSSDFRGSACKEQ